MARNTYPDSDKILAESDCTAARKARIADVVRNRQRGLMVVMEDVNNPHNLAAIARSCDAFGVQQIAFTLENHDLFDPVEVGRVSSSSASKWLDYRIFEDGTGSCLRTLQAEGWHVAATAMHEAAQPLQSVDFTQVDQLALLVGNEREGLSPTALEMADSHIYIPMVGMTRSFNVSVATAILLWEITRQRNASEYDFTISEGEAARLIASFQGR